MSKHPKHNLQSIDLNLLKVLDALLLEQNTTRAAEKLGLSQSAVSHALSRLRPLFNDELFVREGGRFSLTPLAKEIAPQVRKIIQQTHQLLSSTYSFDPKTSTRNLIVAMPDYTMQVVLPRLSALIKTSAPHIKLEIRNTNSITVLEELTNGMISMALAVIPRTITARNITVKPIFSDKLVCAAPLDHDFWNGPITMENYLSYQHLEVVRGANNKGWFQQALENEGLERNVQLRLQTFSAIPQLIQQSGLIATEPKRLLEPWADTFQYRICELPFKSQCFTASLLTHHRIENDSGYEWLADFIQMLYNREPH